MKKTTTALIVLALAASVGFANAASNADAVTARMELMKTVGAQTKILGTVARGTFDAAAVSAAAAALHEAAIKTPAAFEANETNAESEALPKIWENYADFTAKAEMLQAAAVLAMNATDSASLGAAMGAIGESCKACHSDYRK